MLKCETWVTSTSTSTWKRTMLSTACFLSTQNECFIFDKQTVRVDLISILWWIIYLFDSVFYCDCYWEFIRCNDVAHLKDILLIFCGISLSLSLSVNISIDLNVSVQFRQREKKSTFYKPFDRINQICDRSKKNTRIEPVVTWIETLKPNYTLESMYCYGNPVFLFFANHPTKVIQEQKNREKRERREEKSKIWEIKFKLQLKNGMEWNVFAAIAAVREISGLYRFTIARNGVIFFLLRNWIPSHTISFKINQSNWNKWRTEARFIFQFANKSKLQSAFITALWRICVLVWMWRLERISDAHDGFNTLPG